MKKVLLKKWNITQKSINNEVKKQTIQAKAHQDAFDREEKKQLKQQIRSLKNLKLEADKKIEKELVKHRRTKAEMEALRSQEGNKSLREAKKQQT